MLTKIRTLLFLLLLSVTASAQTEKYTLSFTDSIVADQGTTFLYNNISIKNVTDSTLAIRIKLSAPGGWQLLSNKQFTILVAANKDTVIPITIVKRLNASSYWQAFKIEIKQSDDTIAHPSYFNLRAEAVSSFIVTQPEATFINDPRTFATTFHLKNTGNTDGIYNVYIVNEEINMHYRSSIRLMPGQDSSCSILYTVPKDLWNKMNNETFQFTVTDSLFIKYIHKKGDNAYHNNVSNPFLSSFDISREDSVFKMHASPYTPLNLNLETGYLSTNNHASYFGALTGILPFNETSSLAFSYRSRQYGLYNVLDREIYDVNYTSKRLFIHVGKITNAKYFNTYGNGISIGYRLGDNASVTIFAVKHTPGFYTTNDNAGINVKYKAGKIGISNDLLYNTDSANRLNSYIINNDISLLNTKKATLTLNGGIGLQQNLLNQPGIAKTIIGGYGGYRIKYASGDWAFNSLVKYFSNSFSGINAGSRLQSHSIRYRKKKISTEVYYDYSEYHTTYFKDTLYNTDVLSYNTSRYGVRFYIPFKASSITVGSGILSQVGQTYSFAPKYNFFECQYSYQNDKRIGASLSTTTGYANISNHLAYITSNTASVNYHFFGVSGGYSSVPVFENAANNERVLTYNNRTVYGGPYLSLAYRQLSFGTQYSISQTLYDNSINSFLGVNIGYTNARNGIHFSLNCSAPLQRPTQASTDPIKYGYLNVLFSKRLSVPFIFKRTYHDVKVKMYDDVNGNGIMDEGDVKLKGTTFSINSTHFITDQHGAAQYKNADTGKYLIDLTNTSVKGYLPGKGISQTIEVDRHSKKLVEVPFKKSRTISGHINIIQDTASDIKFRADKIKITARDTSGYTYVAIANSDGNYFLNVPAGMYAVSLNPEAFNDFFKPVKMFYQVDMINSEKGEVNFEVKQRKREMRLIAITDNATITVKKKDEGSRKNKPAIHQKKMDNKPAVKQKP